jgi:apolipoprotein N-acyltransferase
VLAVLASAALYGLSFPPARLRVLAWVALVPWFVVLRRANLRAALVLTTVGTLGALALVASWLPRAVANYYAQPLVAGVGVFVGVWVLTVGLWVLAFAFSYRALARRLPVGLPIVVAAAWVATELGRVRLLIGNPFGLLGYSQVGAVHLAQIADVTGVYGVSFAVTAVNVALAELCIALGWGTRSVRRACVDLSIALAVLLIGAGYGTYRLHTASGAAATDAATPLAIVQGNLSIGSQWHDEFYGRNFDVYVRLTREALRDYRPQLVVWPENTMTFFLENATGYQQALGQLLSPSRVQLLAGGPRWDADATGAHYYNSMFLIAPAGGIVARYDKEQLLPFAESFPLGSGTLVRRQFANVQEFASGTQTGPLPTVAGAAGILICNEVMFPELAGARVHADAAFLVNPSNDSWIPSPQFSAQALDMARFRAMEQRRYLVRASTSGPSAIVDPWGRILSETAPATQATLSGAVRAETTITPYGRFGDLFGIICAVVTLLGLASPRRTGRRRAADPSAR